MNSSFYSDCTICGASLVGARELIVITKPDRFERAVGVNAEGYRRAWIECTGCSAAMDVLPDDSQRLLPEVESA